MSIAKSLTEALEAAGLPIDDPLVGRPIVVATIGKNPLGCRVTVLTAIRGVLYDRRSGTLNIALDEAPIPVDSDDPKIEEIAFCSLFEVRDGAATAEVACYSKKTSVFHEVKARFEVL